MLATASVVTTLSQRKAKVKDRCNICFSLKHKTVEHENESKCPVCKAVKSHHHAICPTLFENNNIKASVTNAGTATGLVPTKPNLVNKKILYAAAETGAHTTVRIQVINPTLNRPYFIRAILDNGTNSSYMSKTAACRMGLRMHSYTKLPLGTFLNEELITVNSSETTVYISNGSDFQWTLPINTLPRVPQTTTLFDYDEFKVSHPQYAHYHFVPHDDNSEIELVLGSDCFWNLLEPETKIQVAECTFLYRTIFGWALVGRPFGFDSPNHTGFFLLKPQQAGDKLCALEAIGIHDLPLSSLKEEELALKSFYVNLAFQDERYCIRWP